MTPIRIIAAASLALFCAATSAASDFTSLDPFARYAPESLDAALAAFRRGQEEPLRRWLRNRRHANDAELGRAYSALCWKGLHSGQYPAARRDCRRSLDLVTGEQSSGIKNSLKIVSALATAPPPTATTAGASPALDSSNQVQASIGSVSLPMIVDSGAEMTVLMRSIADQAGVEVLAEDIDVGTTTAPVKAALGLVSELKLGTTSVRNVPALLLPDEMLTFDNGNFRIEGLVGLPVLLAFDRISWANRGTKLLLGNMSPAAGDGAPLFWHESGVAVAVQGEGRPRTAHFDTGANKSFLFEDGLNILSKEERSAITTVSNRRAGVGGEVTEESLLAPKVTVRIGSSAVVLEDVRLSRGKSNGDALHLGIDVVRSFDRVTLDFRRMRLSLKR